MPHCENCGMTEVKPETLGVDELGKVVCPGCRIGPPFQPTINPPIKYGLHLTSEDGFKAEIAVGEVVFSIAASAEQIQRFMK